MTEYKKKRSKLFARTMNFAVLTFIFQLTRHLFTELLWLAIPNMIAMLLTIFFGVRYLLTVFSTKRGDTDVKRKVS